MEPHKVAKMLIETSGDGAEGGAPMRVIEMRILGVPYGEAMWLSVLDAIKRLRLAPDQASNGDRRSN
jgi:hypothetical protein